MPELAEVEFYRKRWNPGLNARVLEVQLHPHSRIFRQVDPQMITKALTGSVLRNSGAAAKQMLFQFNRNQWIGLHLGMTGELRIESHDYTPGKHDHFVLKQARSSLVFSDPRMFGLIQYHHGATPPDWWTSIAPAILSSKFTVTSLVTFLHRRPRPPIKSVLLMQECFPGVGNWMADEILWRAAIHPARPAGSLSTAEQRTLWRECRQVCRLALRKIAGEGGSLPPDLNVHIPDSWLFNHRWRDGGRCPKTGAPLIREEIGGRTTCWSPGRQSL